MAINFPSSPTDQQVYTDTASGNQFIYFSTPGVWKNIKTTPSATSSILETVDKFTGNGSNTQFTISAASTTNNSIVTVSGVVQIPTTAYSISGTTITFTEAIPSGLPIEVRTGSVNNAYGNASTLANYYFLSTSSQTTFTGADQNSNTLAYTPGYETVYVNGSKLVRGIDYTATTGSSVVLTNAAALNDVVEIVSYQNFTFINQTTSSLSSITVNSLVYETAAILTTSTVSQYTLDTLDTTTYRSAKYLIQCTDNVNSRYHVMELLLIHDGTTAYIMPYGSTYTYASLFTVDATISGTSSLLQVTPVVGNSTFKLHRIATVL